MKINTRAIDKIIIEFLQELECYWTGVCMDTDFGFDLNTNTLYYTLLVSERMDTMFMENAFNLGLKVNCGVFIASLLHEVGHYKTKNLITDTEWDLITDVKSTIDADSDDDVWVYFNLKDEKLATLWAIDYINNNIEICQKYAIKLQKAIEKFLKKYEISIDND